MSTATAWFGVDPGKRGACALLLGADTALVEDIPLAGNRQYDFQALCRLVYRLTKSAPYGVTGACIERPQIRSRESGSSGLTSGVGLGAWMTAFALVEVPVYLVHASTWKAQCALNGTGKEGSLQLARALFPAASLAKATDDGRAEALLIARWGETHLRRTFVMRRKQLVPVLELDVAPPTTQAAAGKARAVTRSTP